MIRPQHLIHFLLFGIGFGAFCASYAQTLPVNPKAKLSLGANVGHQHSAYRTKSTTNILPHGFYDNNRWYIEGGEVGFYPHKGNKHHARIGISYDGRRFNPDDANDVSLKALDERKPSVLAQASYMHLTPIGGLKAKISADIGNRHHGTVVTLSHVSRFNMDRLTVYPSFGVAWYDKKYNNYYYGISERESERSGLKTYRAGDDITPFISAMANYDMNDKVALFANQRFEWLSSSQKNSPMVDDNIESTTRLGVSYKF